jgi:Icc protein
MDMLRLAFITDQHISVGVENPFGIDTNVRFLDLLDIISGKNYDGIILGGDLCYMVGDVATYQWYRKTLESLKIPFYIIPGNHDDPVMMGQVFNGLTVHEEKEIYYQTSWGDIEMLFLDTTKGFMLDNQYTWLEKTVAGTKHADVWICMHHPPVLTGSKHMDGKYAFQQIEKFGQFCARFPEKRFQIFSGHCHLERTISTGNMQVHITPSTYINIDPDFEEFTPLSLQKSGYRELVWPEPGMFLTNVLYSD